MPNDDCSADAVESIESLVLSFLSQLSLSFPPVHDADEGTDEDAVIRKKMKTQKIELVLADRKKITSDGCVPYRSFTVESKESFQVYGYAFFTLPAESQAFR
jgi:hypothetical protein